MVNSVTKSLINYVVRELESNLFIRTLFFKVGQCGVRRLEVNHVKRELPRCHLGTEFIPQDNGFLATVIRSVNLDPLAFIGSPTCPRSVIFAGIHRFRNVLYKINSCADPVISLYAVPAQFLIPLANELEVSLDELFGNDSVTMADISSKIVYNWTKEDLLDERMPHETI